jgi:hypothetical protein
VTVRDIFGLIVRVGGLICIIFGFFDIFHVVATLAGLPLPQRYTASADAVGAVFYFITGSVLLFGANLITRLAYWRGT